MIIHQLTQGSAEWHAYRAQHNNASDAPAMMGESPYKSRTELLHERATGIAKEVSAITQQLFDEGHRFEALARARAEEHVGEDLYPVTGSFGKESASFDGLTMSEMICWEHKSLNEDIRGAKDVSDLGLHYRIQMEQQLMISGARKCLFSATRWDANDELVEEKNFWYLPDFDLRARIVAGWEQFEKDLAEYKPREIAEKPKADAIMHLPALVIQIRGEVTVSNLPQFRAAAETFIAAIKTDLQTDEDFANAEATVKFCEKAEKELAMTQSAAIAQTASIDELMRTVDFIRDELRNKRLALSGLVVEKKKQIKEKIIREAREKFAQHIASLDAEIAPLRLVVAPPDFVEAAKNKRTMASLHNAIDSELANGKILADAQAKAVRGRLAWFGQETPSTGFLFPDIQQLIGKSDEDFQLAVKNRISQHQRAEDERIEAERKRSQNPVSALAGGAPASTASTSTVRYDSEAKALTEDRKQPTPRELVSMVARAYHVDGRQALEWLVQADFKSLKLLEAA